MALRKKATVSDTEIEVVPRTVAMSLRLDRDMHDRLRKLAFDKRCSMRDFIVQGIESVLKSEKY